MAAKKKPAAKSAPKNKPRDVRDPIGDALVRGERAKYGPYVKNNEAQYAPGDLSKKLKGYSKVTGYIPRSQTPSSRGTARSAGVRVPGFGGGGSLGAIARGAFNKFGRK
jgi:hypothetical protein